MCFQAHSPSSLSFTHKHSYPLFHSIPILFISHPSSSSSQQLGYIVFKAKKYVYLSETASRRHSPHKSSSKTQQRMEAICQVGDQYQNSDSLSNSKNSLVDDLPPPPEPFPLDLLSENVSTSIGSRAESDQIVSVWRSLDMRFERGHFHAV